MNAIASSLSGLPFAQYRKNPRFYLHYDAVYAVLGLSFIALLQLVGYRPPVTELSWWHVPVLLPIATYVVIMAHVFIHNASHGNFPKAINRIAGEICGVIVLTKFASWEIVHRRHHRYSDDPERDPHPAERHYWRYAYNTLVNVEKQLQQQYFDLYGDTPETRRYETWRARFSFASGLMLIAGWIALLGVPLFLAVFLPASVLGGLFVIHFNWSGHNAHTRDGKIEPVNLDHGWYWFGNRIFFGIYYHANHHKMAMLFNPMRMPARAAVRARETESEGDDAEIAA